MLTFIEIESPDVVEEKSSKGNILRSQLIYMWTIGKKYPQEYRLSLGNNAPPYPKGKYLLSGKSFRPDNFGGLELDRYNVQLEALTADQVKALGI